MADSLTDAPTWRLCVAPMMAWTDRHCRAIHRLLAPRARLYTEMIGSDALLKGPGRRLLAHRANGHPLALQLGGSDPDALAACARIGEADGYDEINLNVGCPSDRVQRGAIGAVLMLEPERVRDCVAAMHAAVALPVTVKCRIGVDAHDEYDFLATFAESVIEGGCETLIVHARKAILAGLSPAQNRSVPPLNYSRVYRLKRDFPTLRVIVNGGISALNECHAHRAMADGVMLGRAAYRDPWLLVALDESLFGGRAHGFRGAALDAVCDYAEEELARGARLHDITRHLHGWFNGLPGARGYRRYLSEHAHARGAGVDVLRAARDLVDELPLAACSNA